MTSNQIVIIGGGPAGLATALFLAAEAPELHERIVVLERARYPREKPCAGAIGRRADRALDRIGVRVNVPSVRISAMKARFTNGDVCAARPFIGRVVRRLEFDAALAAIVRAQGIRLEEGARVTGLRRNDDGVVVELEGERSIHASVVIGADGVGSVVRRAMGIPFGRLRAQVVEIDTEPVGADLERDRLGFDFSNPTYAGYAWDFPTTVGGEALVCRGAYVLHGARAHPSGPDPDAILDAHLDALGLDRTRYKRKRYSERGLSLSRPIAQPRIVLVGEAAGIDPLLGEGIAQGIVYGELAAKYLAPRIARRAFDFFDWRRTVLSSKLGIDLAARIALVDVLFGPQRRALENYVRDEPAFMDAGLRYFGGEPFLRPLARATVSGAKAIVRAILS
jgi:flavin-dependent dehydrogenase